MKLTDDSNVHMLDQLSYYKVEYPDKCSQKNPYVPEEREWLDANKKLRGLMKAELVILPNTNCSTSEWPLCKVQSAAHTWVHACSPLESRMRRNGASPVRGRARASNCSYGVGRPGLILHMTYKFDIDRNGRGD